jgi:hypothetical protein
MTDTDVQAELRRQEGGGGDDPMAAFDAAIARASKGGGAPRAQRATREPKRGKGKRSPQHAVDEMWTRKSLEPTGRKTLNGQPIARPSREALKTFLGEQGTNDVAANLVFSDPRAPKPEPQKTGRQLADEAIARTNADPGMQKWREGQRVRQAEDIGNKVDSVLLRGFNIVRAWEEGELDDDQHDRLMFGVARELYRVSPAALDKLAEFQNENWDWGDEEFDSPEAFMAAQPGNQLVRAVRDAEAHAQAVDRLVTSQAQIEGITQMNLRKFESGIKELGVSEPEDEELYTGLTSYVQDATGISPGHLALTEPDRALDLMRSASAQLGHHARAQATREFHRELLAEQDRSVQAGLVTGADQSNAKLDELINAVRSVNGEGPVGEEIPEFDPSWEPPVPARSEPADEMTVGEFKRDLLTPEVTSVKDGLTDGDGNPITLEKAARPDAGVV